MSKRTAPDDPAGPEDEDDEEFPSDEVLLRPRTRQHVLAEVDGELALLPTELQLIITYRLAIRPTMRLAMSNRTLMFLVDHAFVTLFKRDVLAQIGDNKPPDFYGDNPISNLFKLTRPRADLLPMPRTEPERAGRQKLELARVYKAVFEQLALIMADKIGTTLEFVFMNMTIGKRDVSITFFDPTDEDGEEESSFEVYIRAATSIGLVHSHTAKPELIQLARRVYEFVPKVRDYIQEDPLQERPPSPELMGILQSLFFEISPFYQTALSNADRPEKRHSVDTTRVIDNAKEIAVVEEDGVSVECNSFLDKEENKREADLTPTLVDRLVKVLGLEDDDEDEDEEPPQKKRKVDC